MSWYLDSSAILKLIFKEVESSALLAFLVESPTSSSLGRLEVIRVVQRSSPQDLHYAKRLLGTFAFIPINEAVIRIAENFTEAPTLRSLDAIHIASALLVQSSIEGIITYDETMAKAANNSGLRVLSPR
jgi:predicted nucleic acid-binding protein